jgi:CheY-like chemotaxis protein
MANKVLVVDDDVLTQRVLKHYLERAGYQMIGASNGREAIKLAKQELPRLIILDVMMPDMDGWAVMRQIQTTEATRTIPVILLSGNAELVATEEAIHSGATQVLVKPINPEQLLGVIKNILPDISEEPHKERS